MRILVLALLTGASACDAPYDHARAAFLTYMVSLLTFLLAVAVVLNLPLLLLILGLRRRLPRQVCGALVGAGFAAAVGYMIWRMEWFDVWRHGTPPASYMVTAFGPYMSAFGALGYAVGHAIARKEL